MRVSKRMVVVSALALALASGPVFAQTPPPQNPPAQNPPATQPPVPPPSIADAPPAPFPEGAKIAYVVLDRIAQGSAEGKAAAAKIQALQKQKMGEIQEKSKGVEELKKKLDQGGTVLSEQARAQIEKDIDRNSRELQFMQQNAQAEAEQLERELNNEFQRKLNPILEAVAKEKGLHMLFSIRDNGALWADRGLDLSNEVIKRLDSASKAPPKKE